MSRDLRSVLHSAFVFVRSVEANRASAAITLDHVIEQQIKFLKPKEKRTIVDATGSSMGDRLSRYDRLQQLQDDLTKIMQKIEEAGTNEEELKKIGIYEVDQGAT